MAVFHHTGNLFLFLILLNTSVNTSIPALNEQNVFQYSTGLPSYPDALPLFCFLTKFISCIVKSASSSSTYSGPSL
jgi:hypothetical protein